MGLQLGNDLKLTVSFPILLFFITENFCSVLFNLFLLLLFDTFKIMC